MGLVQQGWVGQSRGKMPLPRFYWQPWERHLAAIHLLIAAGRRSHGSLPQEPPKGKMPLPRRFLLLTSPEFLQKHHAVAVVHIGLYCPVEQSAIVT